MRSTPSRMYRCRTLPAAPAPIPEATARRVSTGPSIGQRRLRSRRCISRWATPSEMPVATIPITSAWRSNADGRLDGRTKGSTAICLFGRDARGRRGGSYEMGDLWLGRSVESANGILNDAIRVRDALVLSKVLEPGGDHESFQKTPFLGRVFEDVPGVRAVPPSLLAQIPDRGQESITSLGIDAVFNGDQYRPPVSIRLDRQNRSRP